MVTINKNLTAAAQVSDPALTVVYGDQLLYSVSGVFVGTCVLERSGNGGLNWEIIGTFTAAASATIFNDSLAHSNAGYRFRCTAYTSGTIVVSIADVAGELLDQGQTLWTNKQGTKILEIKEDGIVALSPITITGLTAKGVVTTNASSQLASTALTDGQLMIGSTGNVPVAAVLTPGLGISITNAPGSVTVATIPGTVGTLCDIYDGAVKIVNDAVNLKFEASDFVIAASGTTALVSIPTSSESVEGIVMLGSGASVTAGKAVQCNDPRLHASADHYDATYIVGAGAQATHATLALAVAAHNAGAVPSLIRVMAGTHTIAASLTLDVSAGKNLAIFGAGSATRLDYTSSGNSLYCVGNGNLTLGDFDIDANTSDCGIFWSGSNAADVFHARNIGIYEGTSAYGGFLTTGVSCSVQLDNCRYSGTGNSGFDIRAFSKLNNCYATGADNGFRDASNSQYNGCRAVSCTDYGFYVPTSTGQPQWNGCHASYCGYGFEGGIVQDCVSTLNTYSGVTNPWVCNGSHVSTNGWNGVSMDTSPGTVSGNRIYGNARSGVTSSLKCIITGNVITDNNTSTGYDGIRVYGAQASGCTITGNTVTGAHGYGICEVTSANNNVFGGNVVAGAITSSYLILGAGSRVLDPCSVSGHIHVNHTVVTSGATITTSALGTGSCPRNFTFSAVDDGAATSYSTGNDNGVDANCVRSAAGASALDITKSVYVLNGASGYTGKISILGAAGGAAQDQFSIDLDWIGASGRTCTIYYEGWR